MVGEDQRQSVNVMPAWGEAEAWGYSPQWSRRCLHSFEILFYAGPTLDSAFRKKHAAPDRQILAVVRHRRGLRSARAGGRRRPAARLLYSPGSPPVPRLFRGNRPAGRPRHILLQTRLLPSRQDIRFSASATDVGVSIDPASQCSDPRVPCGSFGRRPPGITISPRPSASLHRLT